MLKELHPEYYSILSRVLVPAHAAGEPSSLYRPKPQSGFPVLGHDRASTSAGDGDFGELVQVRWNNDDRSVMSGLDAAMVEQWYAAIRAWDALLKSPDSEYWVQLEPGTAVGSSPPLRLEVEHAELSLSC
jgi:trimethyllysine dioxygenase